jgi:hypothetical protein
MGYSRNINWSTIAAALLLFFLFCPFGASETMPGIRVERDHGNPFLLRVELRSGEETRVTIYKSRLPWGSAYSMILVAAMPDGQTLKKELPVDDPSPDQVSLNPKESIQGEIDLRNIFRGLEGALRKSDVQLFWAYEAPDELHMSRWSGGWILIPRQK